MQLLAIAGRLDLHQNQEPSAQAIAGRGAFGNDPPRQTSQQQAALPEHGQRARRVEETREFTATFRPNPEVRALVEGQSGALPADRHLPITHQVAPEVTPEVAPEVLRSLAVMRGVMDWTVAPKKGTTWDRKEIHRVGRFLIISQAKVAELADAPDLGSGGETLGGSNPPFRTTPSLDQQDRVGAGARRRERDIYKQRLRM